MSDLFAWNKAAIPRKGSIETVKFGNFEKIQKKLVGSSIAVIEKFEELFQQSRDLFLKCSQFSEKELNDSFEDRESEAIELARDKQELEATIHKLYEKYKDQKLPKLDPKAVMLKRESKLIIERVQRSIEKCRPLIDEIRQRRKIYSSKESVDLGKIVDFGEEIMDPFDNE